MLRGDAYMRNKDPSAALRDFTKAIELNPRMAKAYRERGHAGILLETFEQAEQDLTQAIQLSPRDALSFAYRALMYKKLGQPELGAQEVRKSMLLGPKDARVHWAKGEIDEALSRPEEAAQAYRRALEIDPNLQNAVYGLKRLGEDVPSDMQQHAELGIDAWQVFSEQGKFWAAHPEFGDLKVPLEMSGAGEPKLLAWELQSEEFAHIGLLRFSTGEVATADGTAAGESAAIINTKAGTLLGVEPHKLGKATSRWSWGSGRIRVAALDGISQEYVVRREQQVAVPVTRRRRRNSANGVPDWAPWADNATSTRARRSRKSRRRVRRSKPKTLFDLLLGN